MTGLDPERLLRTLAEHEVEFCVIGAVAAWLQGNPSVTLGLDVMPRRDLDNADRLEGEARPPQGHRGPAGPLRHARGAPAPARRRELSRWLVRCGNGSELS
jgi:hypothetical protein